MRLALFFIKTRDLTRENINYSHNKMSSKQNLKFIVQPLIVGSEINTTLKETLINIKELPKNDPANYEIRAICYTSL